MCLKCCTQYASKFGKFSSGHRTGKGQFSFQQQRRKCQRMFKLLYNGTHFTCQQCSTQNLQARLQQYVNLGIFRCSSWIQKRQRNQRSNCQHPLDHRKGKKNCFKKSTSASLTILILFTGWVTMNWKILKKMGIPISLPASFKNCMQVKKQQLEPDME